MKFKTSLKVSLVAASIVCTLHANDTKKLDTVTVTAQKTEENVQEIPITVNIIDEFLIEDKKIENMEDLTKVTPNLYFVNPGTSGVGSPTLRGLHGDFHSFNTPAVVLVDGVPILNGLGYNTSIFDVERVEVLKGPQGTLYGKNSESGVINIISKKPSNELSGKLALALGSDNKREFNMNVSGPVIEDKLYLGLSARKDKQDGFIKNKYLDKEVGDKESLYAKLYVRATPNDNLDISLISSFIQYDDTDSWIGLKTSKRHEVNSDIDGFNKAKTYLNSLKFEYDLDDLKFESITAHKKFIDDAQQDWDFLNPSHKNYVYTYHERRPTEDNFSTLSQEFRLSSSFSNLKWLTGVYLDKDKVNFHSEQMGTSNVIKDTIDSNSIGLFAHATYDINEKFSLIGGIRYDKEKKKHKEFDKEETFSAFSPKLAFNYNINKDSMAYINIAKGYRAGGFNTSSSSVSSNLQSFDQESLISYEIGMKNRLLDDKMLLNLALYYMDISDMQVKTAINPYEGYVSNAGQSTSKGIELELNYQFTPNLTFFTNLGYNKTEFDDFKDNTFDNLGNPTGTVNYKGNENIYAPKYNYNLGLSYRNDSGFFARADLNGFGSMYTDKQNTNKVDSYKLVDAKIGYEQDSYEIHLYGKNIFDKNYDTEGYNNDYVIYSKPREIGVQFTYRF